MHVLWRGERGVSRVKRERASGRRGEERRREMEGHGREVHFFCAVFKVVVCGQ